MNLGRKKQYWLPEPKETGRIAGYAGCGVEILTLDDFPSLRSEEDGQTMAENAVRKPHSMNSLDCYPGR